MPNTQREADERVLMSRAIDVALEALGWAATTQDRRKALDLLSAARAAIDQSASHASLEKLRAIGAAWMGEEGRDALEDWIAQQAAPEVPASEQQKAIYQVAVDTNGGIWKDVTAAEYNECAHRNRRVIGVDTAATTASAIGGQRWSKEVEMMESWGGTMPSREATQGVIDVLRSIIQDGYLSDTNTARGHAALARVPLPD